MGRLSHVAALGLSCALAGCASFSWEQNAALPQGGKLDAPYALASVADRTDPRYLILFAFSGGGKRSASFGYGALKAARAVEMPDKTTLTKQIDMVSGVSGGSFTASAFALYGDGIFDDRLVDPRGKRHPSYKSFLNSDTNASILEIYLDPLHWQWMANPHIGTNDEMEQTYERDLFGDTTYKDMALSGRPYLIVQATDLDAQQPFTFTQTDFDLICSDLSSVKLSRAVAASNGFPVLFSPIGLEMYSYPMSPGAVMPGNDKLGPCPDLPWRHPAAPYKPFSREALLAGRADLYAPSGMRKDQASYVHLADGGLSDNLALRGAASIWTRMRMQMPSVPCSIAVPSSADADACETLGRLHLEKVEHILIVSVDGEAEPDRTKEIGVPVLGGLTRIADTVLNSVIDSANLSTLPLAAEATEDFRQTVGSLKCRAAGLDDMYCKTPPAQYLPKATFAHVALSEWSRNNPALAGDAGNSPTGLSLRAGDAATLTGAGCLAFLSNDDIRTFLADVGAQVGTDRPCAKD
jgi:NTE family protein